jgi:HEAT repeat protein
MQTAAMKALVTWATRENVPAIILVVQNDDFNPQALESRHLAMDALARLKDDRGVAPVAQRLTNVHDRSNASKALRAMGSMAEKEVATYLDNSDFGTQKEACAILKVIGTKASIPALEKASKNRNPLKANAAKDALNAVKARGG